VHWRPKYQSAIPLPSWYKSWYSLLQHRTDCDMPGANRAVNGAETFRWSHELIEALQLPLLL